MPDALQRLLAVIAGVLTLPFVAAFGIAIKVDSPGPMIYRSARFGGGRLFACFKLRTMRSDAYATGAQVTAHRDARVTRVGRLLRRYRLDELPQVWNVARGEMRFVGPRPEDPTFVDPADSLHREVFAARPGITGLTQLLFHDEAELLRDAADVNEHYRRHVLPRKLAIDAAYLRQRSTRLDLWILAQTPRAVLGQRVRLPEKLASEIEQTERAAGVAPGAEVDTTE